MSTVQYPDLIFIWNWTYLESVHKNSTNKALKSINKFLKVYYKTDVLLSEALHFPNAVICVHISYKYIWCEEVAESKWGAKKEIYHSFKYYLTGHFMQSLFSSANTAPPPLPYHPIPAELPRWNAFLALHSAPRHQWKRIN